MSKDFFKDKSLLAHMIYNNNKDAFGITILNRIYDAFYRKITNEYNTSMDVANIYKSIGEEISKRGHLNSPSLINKLFGALDRKTIDAIDKHIDRNNYKKVKAYIREKLLTQNGFEIRECKNWFTPESLGIIHSAAKVFKDENLYADIPKDKYVSQAKVGRFRYRYSQNESDYVYVRMGGSTSPRDVYLATGCLRYVVPDTFEDFMKKFRNQPLEYFSVLGKLSEEIVKWVNNKRVNSINEKMNKGEMLEMLLEPFKKTEDMFRNHPRQHIEGIGTGGEYYIMGTVAYNNSNTIDLNYMKEQLYDKGRKHNESIPGIINFHLTYESLKERTDYWWNGGKKLTFSPGDIDLKKKPGDQVPVNETKDNPDYAGPSDPSEEGDTGETGINDIYDAAIWDKIEKVEDQFHVMPSTSTAPDDYTEGDYMSLNLNYDDFQDKFNTIGLSSPLVTYGIGGMPASYLPTTDPPAWEGDVLAGMGYNYMEHYIRYGQFISFQPSITRFDLGVQQAFGRIRGLDGYEGSTTDAVKSVFNTLMSGQLTTLEPRLTNYWLQVSRLMRSAIHVMGIQNSVIEFQTGVSRADQETKKAQQGRGVSFNSTNKFRLGDMHADVWAAIGCGFSRVVGAGTELPDIITGTATKIDPSAEEDFYDYGIVAFLADGPIEPTESIDNKMSESAIAELIQDVAGKSSGIVNEIIKNTPGLREREIFNFFTGKYTTPNIWSGMDFNQSYGFKAKFTSASGDPVSTLMNVVFPYVKLLALALPEATGGMLYSPWISSIHSTGTINIDYGIVNSLSVDKDLATVNDGGQPTSLSVNVSIANLRPFLYQEKPKWVSMASKSSQSATNFIATLVGANITTGMKPDALAEYRKSIGELNYAEAVSVMPRQIKMGVHRWIGRIGRYFRRLGRAGNDKWTSTKTIYRTITGQDAFESAARKYRR